MDLENEGVCRIQSRRNFAFPHLRLRPVGEVGKEIPAPVSVANCDDPLGANRAPSSENPLPEMTSETSLAHLDLGSTDSMYDSALVWAV